MSAESIAAQRWEGWIQTTAEAKGWECSTTPSTHNSPMPKMFLYRAGEMLVVQAPTVKRKGSGLSDGQQRHLDVAATVPGVESVVWSPADMDAATERLSREPADA